MVSLRNSVALRYVVISLLAATVPLLIVGALYDRYSSGLVQSLTGERLDRRLAAISGRLRSFMDTRRYDLETLSGYPAMPSLLAAHKGQRVETTLKAIVQFAADQPDLYGVLLFSTDGRLIRSIPGRAAAGAPYWGRGVFSLKGSRRVTMVDGEVIGPIPPKRGSPGSFLIIRDLPGAEPGARPAGRIALHVRLASLTELMGTADETGLFHPVLLTPNGVAYANVGTITTPKGRLVKGPQIMPGWFPALVVKWDELAAPLQRVRYVMIAVLAVLTVALPWLFVSLFRAITGRISQLVDGAREVATGNLAWRIRAAGNDEIAILARAFNGMAERLQQVIRSAVKVEKMAVLGQFSTSLAHEVRNPLAAMKTSVQALSAEEHNDERHAILAGMGEEIDRLDATLEDLLRYARPREPRFETVSVRDVFRRIRAMVETQARAADVRISTSGRSDMMIRADTGHVQQILMNLTLNSLQAMPDGGQLMLRASARNGVARIEITDTGHGIEEAMLARITDPFFTTRADGTGLGLAVSRQLAELNHGSLQFTSRPEQGTTAILSLRSVSQETS